eukprot:scaffold105085_cov32-Tisochrysis_lutea.AAC.3
MADRACFDTNECPLAPMRRAMTWARFFTLLQARSQTADAGPSSPNAAVPLHSPFSCYLAQIAAHG